MLIYNCEEYLQGEEKCEYSFLSFFIFWEQIKMFKYPNKAVSKLLSGSMSKK